MKCLAEFQQQRQALNIRAWKTLGVILGCLSSQLYSRSSEPLNRFAAYVTESLSGQGKALRRTNREQKEHDTWIT